MTAEEQVKALQGQVERLRKKLETATESRDAIIKSQNAVERFLQYIKEHPTLTFLITPVGCGHAGFDVEKVANMFKETLSMTNVMLPKLFLDVYRKDCNYPPQQPVMEVSVKSEEVHKVGIYDNYANCVHRVIDYLLDNEIPFDKNGNFLLLDDKGEVRAEAELGIESEKIVFYPFNSQSEIAFRNKGYTIYTADEYLAMKETQSWR